MKSTVITSALVLTLVIGLSACSRVEEREYEMTWKIEEPKLDKWPDAEHVLFRFPDEYDRWEVIVSDDLGDYLRHHRDNPVTTTWRTSIYLGFIDAPEYLLKVGDIDDFDRKMTYYVIQD